MIPQSYPLFVVTVENWDGGDGPEFDVTGPDRVIGWHETSSESYPVKTGPLGTACSDAYEQGVIRRYHYFDDYDAATTAKQAITQDALKTQQERRQCANCRHESCVCPSLEAMPYGQMPGEPGHVA
jgi:hypothetical protein